MGIKVFLDFVVARCLLHILSNFSLFGGSCIIDVGFHCYEIKRETLWDWHLQGRTDLLQVITHIPNHFFLPYFVGCWLNNNDGNGLVAYLTMYLVLTIAISNQGLYFESGDWGPILKINSKVV